MSTTRRPLGIGPDAPAHGIRATQADLLDTLPGVHLPDLDELRARGVLHPHTAPPRSPRRVLGAGRRPDDDPSPQARVTGGPEQGRLSQAE
ncbi:hypothetical protein ACH40E_38005 [Streptomyces acidicola]|uniref:hypothetical protein n=1 Tax=Streptomyces acidicola TaxID=2596892 RepID=UPI00379271E7